MNSKYVDIAAIAQVIGNVFNNTDILDQNDKYIITDEDFPQEFHKIIFGAMYNLYLNHSKVNIDTIVDYLANRPKYEAVFKTYNGIDYLLEVSKLAQPDSFNYYYARMKKFTLLRAFDDFGLDVRFLYDPDNILDGIKKQKQEDWLDNTTLAGIAETIDKKIADVKYKYLYDTNGASYQAGDGAVELIESLETTPEVGIPLYGSLINTVTRGARLRKFYLRSGATGLGKSRAMIADSCNFACDEIYDEQFSRWAKNGFAEPTLFIATEQDKSEVQTMMMAFLSNVNEGHILDGKYEEGERERVIKAALKLKESPLWIEELPDFSLEDVENTIKRHIREHDVKYIVFDYLQTSLKILEEITKKTGGVRLREDNILFMLSAKLKDIANQYGVFIMTGTQLNANYQDSDTPDQNLLRGAKSIADRADLGMILLSVTNTDLEKITPIIQSSVAFAEPNMKISVYKNRRGAYKGIYLFCHANLGTCRIEPQFATNWRYELISISDLKIMAKEECAWKDE